MSCDDNIISIVWSITVNLWLVQLLLYTIFLIDHFQPMRAANSDYALCSIPRAKQNHWLLPTLAVNGQLRIWSIHCVFYYFIMIHAPGCDFSESLAADGSTFINKFVSFVLDLLPKEFHVSHMSKVYSMPNWPQYYISLNQVL